MEAYIVNKFTGISHIDSNITNSNNTANNRNTNGDGFDDFVLALSWLIVKNTQYSSLLMDYLVLAIIKHYPVWFNHLSTNSFLDKAGEDSKVIHPLFHVLKLLSCGNFVQKEKAKSPPAITATTNATASSKAKDIQSGDDQEIFKSILAYVAGNDESEFASLLGSFKQISNFEFKKDYGKSKSFGWIKTLSAALYIVSLIFSSNSDSKRLFRVSFVEFLIGFGISFRNGLQENDQQLFNKDTITLWYLEQAIKSFCNSYISVNSAYYSSMAIDNQFSIQLNIENQKESDLWYDNPWSLHEFINKESDFDGSKIIELLKLRPDLFVNISGYFLPIRRESSKKEASAQHVEEVIISTTTAKNLQGLSLAVLDSVSSFRPILVQGTAGSGKTTLLYHLAQQTGNVNTLVELQIDDQMDSKTLLGTYVCTDVPGEFKWQPGTLTQALQKGYWVVIEDIDRVPFEVLSALVSLFENGSLLLPNRNETIYAAPGFCLFATRTVLAPILKGDNSSQADTSSPASSMFSNLWTIVNIESLPKEELKDVALQRYSEEYNKKYRIPKDIIEKMLETFDAISEFYSAEKKSQMDRVISEQSGIQSSQKSLSSFSRQFFIKDLFKWLDRVGTNIKNQSLTLSSSVAPSNASSSNNNNKASLFVTESQKQDILLEALDCFGASLPSVEQRLLLADRISVIWNLAIAHMRDIYLLKSRKPIVDIVIKSSNATDNKIGKVCFRRVGRSYLPIPENAKIPSAPTLAQTAVFLRTIEQISVCVSLFEPVLLVGETGAGKTAILQQLATLCGRKLIVQNMHIQSDGSELLGGYKPVDLFHIAKPLHNDFLDLFQTLFQADDNGPFLKSISEALEKRKWKLFSKALSKACSKAFQRLDSEQQQDESSSSQGSGNSQKSKKQKGYHGKQASISAHDQEEVQDLIEKKEKWQELQKKAEDFDRIRSKVEGSFAFEFEEGALVKAVRNGDWILLDEINLASSETLERLSGLLDSHAFSSLTLTERGDLKKIERHPNFRIFAAMNPATDAGKKDLPPAVRHRFTEIFVDEVEEKSDLQQVVMQFIGHIASPPVTEVVNIYLNARKQSSIGKLVDGAGQSARFSLRTLTRALSTALVFLDRGFGLARSLYESFLMTFVTLLNEASADTLRKEIKKAFIPDMSSEELDAPSKRPSGAANKDEVYVPCGKYWIPQGPISSSQTTNEATIAASSSQKKSKKKAHPQFDADPSDDSFIITPSVARSVDSVARAIAARKYPILLQGPTSTGKTSMVVYLANRTGNKCVRINNHEHTDLQEYLGSYVSDPQTGQLVFKEGILAEAVRNGYWIILDELNLAPSEVLEALNRLLDDNRELYIPETQETLKPHKHFMLFATQNPPGLYGGRKILSRAFRNRFLEIQIDEIPHKELQTILERRTKLAPKFCELMIKIMDELQKTRQQSRIFAGKDGYITVRDLLRWADRNPTSKEDVAVDGFRLLGERIRVSSEKDVVRKIIEKNCEIDLLASFNSSLQLPFDNLSGNDLTSIVGGHNIVWTKSMRRLFALVNRCVEKSEPVLLVGETGCGKTTICQVLSYINQQQLQILNCHQNTETADFLGSLRPIRGRDLHTNRLKEVIQEFYRIIPESIKNEYFNTQIKDDSKTVSKKKRSSPNADNEKEAEDIPGEGKLLQGDITHIQEIYKIFATSQSIGNENTELDKLLVEINELNGKVHGLFEWQDGPLITSMKQGSYILLDELSLAEDAVLERLNSLLEPSRTIVLAERAGGKEADQIVKAHSNFRLFATMNPGGDFGKRELSPALRNRFTEIWIPPITDDEELIEIVQDFFINHLENNMMNWSDLIPKRMVTFISWFNTNCSKYSSTIPIITLRDMLSWSDFICLLSKSKIFNFMEMETKLWEFYIHGAFLCILDGLGLGAGTSLDVAKNFRAECFDFLINQIPENIRSDEDVHEKIISIAGNKQSRKSLAFEIKDSESEEYKLFGHCPFYIPVNKQTLSGNGLKSYALEAPTTGKNAFKVLRAMQLKRPILIEGSPGVGKTSLITALAACCGQTLIRINLSEQTDFSDLIGADLPATANEQENNESSSKTSSQFRWSDGVFLTAIKNGYWVLLDELNLASQTVLEGLNAVLDHRGSVYVPELNQTFVCPPSFRVFGAQNPLQQGGGRKGLPKSFLNRFTKVYVDTLQREDMVMIMQKIHPKLSNQIERLVDFNESIVDDVCIKKLYGRMGSPWEFNLRDVFRCCDLMDNINVEESPKKTTRWLVNHMDLLYLQRMRTGNDRILLRQRMESFFGAEDVSSILDISPDVYYTFSPEPTLVVGDVAIQCKERSMPVELNRSVLPTALYSPLKGIARCIQKSWPVLLLGPPGSGKTSCLNYLSKMTGNPLHVIALTSSTDSTELLGCFEQVDPFRKERKILDKCLLLLDDAISLVLEGYGFTYKGLNTSSNLQHLMSFKIRIEQIKSSESNSSNKNSTSSEFEHHKFSEKIIANIIQLARSVVESHQSIKFVIASDVLEKASELEKDVKAFAKNKKLASVSASFEWVDGVLIRALENGEWVALENANLCSPTTLDRLNPLLEPNGELLVNECGMIDGQPRIVKPHPNFRLFLIADPQHGEVSRAMRNRCVEISLVPTSYSTEKSILPLSNSANEAIQAFHTKEKKEASADSRKFHDFAKIVNGNRFSSFIIAKYLPFMFQIHSKMCSSNSKFKSKKSSNDDEHSNTKTPNARHLLHWIRIFPLHLKNHTELPSSSTLISSFKASFELAYSAFSTTAQNEAKKLVDAFTPSSLTYYENAIVGIYNYNNGIRELLLIKSIDLKQENVNMFRDYMNLNSSYVDQELLCLHLLSQVSSITGALIASDIFASLECTKRFLHMLPLHGENSNALNFEKSLPLLFCYHFFVRLSPALVLKLKDMLLLSSFFKSTENSVSQQMKGCIQDLIQGVLLFDQDERANGFHPLIQSLINLRSSQKIFNGDHVPFVAALHDEYLGLYKQIFEEDKHILYLESLVDLYFIRIIRSVYEKQFLEMDDDIRSFTMNKYVPEKIRKRLLDFFITFAKFEKLMFLSVTNANTDIRISIFSLVSECLYFRDSLWDQVYSSKYLLSRQKSKSYFSELAITWRWLMKRLVKIFNTCIENSLLDMELSDISHLFNIVGQIDSQMPTKSVKISEGAKEIEYISNAKYAWKKNLWKNGGHPLANRTKEACNSVKNLLKIESQIDFKKDEAVFIYERCTPAEIRRYIVEANCAIRFFNSNYFFNEIQSEENSLENTNEAIAVVQEQMKKLSEDCQNGYESLTSILNPAYEKIGEKMVLRKALKEQLWPVVDSMLSKRESLSLVKVSSFISPAMNSIAYQEKLEHAVISIESFLNLAIEVGSKLPSLLSCYNQFIWMNHEGSKSANKKQLLEQSRDLLSEMVISLFMTSFRENFDIEGNSSNTDNEILYPNLNEQSIGANLTYSKKNRMNTTGAILEGFSRGSISTGYTYKFVIGSGLGVDKLRANDKKWSSIIKSNPISLKDWQARSLQLLLFFSYQLEFSNEVFQIQTSEQQLVKNLLNSTLLHTWETVNIEEISKFEGAVDLMNKCDARSILSHLDNQHMSEQDIALTWIKLGLLKMCLYMPISSIDPVLKPNVEYRHLSGSYEQNLMLENVASILKLLRAGSVKTEFRNKLASVLDNIIHSMADASKKIVYRDDEFSYSDMQSDFLAFANDICSCDKVLATCERIRKLSSAKISFDEAQKIQNEEYNFQVSALNFLEQMFTKYSTGVAMDVLYPFCTSIIHIMHGMRLLVEANIKGTENDKGAIFTKLIGFPMHVEPSFDLLENSQRLRDKNLRSQILKSSLIRTQVEVSEDERHNQDQFKTISKIFDMYVEQWKFDKEEEEKKRREDAALFKTVVRAPKVEDMQTEEDEIEFRNMFPDFHAEFEINRDPDTFAPFSSNINNNSTNGNDNNDRNGDTSVFIDKQHDYLLVGKAFLEMFGDKKSKNIIGEESATSSKASKKKSRKNRNTESNFKHEISHKRLESFTQSYQSGYHFLSNGGAKNELLSLAGNIDKATMSSNLTALSLCLGDINSHIVGSDDEDSESTILDIYQETDVSEIIRLSNPLKSTLKRVGELLKDWPDNAILMHIANLTDKIQRLPLQSPLMRSLVGIEVLLAKMNEWEIIAHKGVSLAEQIKAVSNLVFRWRKLELKSWQKVLDTKDKESSQTALRFWFSLYNSIQSSLVGLNKFKQSSDANIEEDDDDKGAKESEEKRKLLATFFQTIDQFMRSSSVAEFETRLKMLFAFAKYCRLRENNDFFLAEEKGSSISSKSSNERVLSNIVLNIASYYDQWSETIKQILLEHRKEAETKLLEFAKIASWDRQSYYSLKESAEKSHRKIHKISKDYETSVKIPIHPIIEKQSDTGVTQSQAQFTLVVKIDDIESKIEPDSASVSKLATSKKKKDADQLNVLENPLYMYQPHDQDYLGREKTILQQHFQKQKYISSFNRYQKKGLQIFHSFWESRLSVAQQESLNIPRDLCLTIAERIKNLRKPSVSVQAKQLAFKDLIQGLQDNGFKTVLNSASSSLIRNIQKLFARDPPRYEFDIEHQPSVRDTDMRRMFFTSLSQTNRLRLTVTSVGCHPDIDRIEANRALGLTESFFELLLQQREFLNKIRQQKQLIERHSRCISRLCSTNHGSSNRLIKIKSGTPLYDAVLNHCDHLNSIISGLRDLKFFLHNLSKIFGSKVLELEKELLGFFNEDGAKRTKEVIEKTLADAKNFLDKCDIQIVNADSCEKEIRHCYERIKLIIDDIYLCHESLHAEEAIVLISESDLEMFRQNVLDLHTCFAYNFKDYFPSVNEQIRECTGVENVLYEFFSFARDIVQIKMGPLTKEISDFDKNDMDESVFSNEFEALAKDIILSIQSLALSEPLKGENAERKLRDIFEIDFQDALNGLRVSKLSKSLVSVCRVLRKAISSSPNSEEVKYLVEKFSKSIQQLLLGTIQTLEIIESQFEDFNQKCCELHLLVSRVIRTAIAKGFCRPNEEKEGQDADGDGDGGEGNDNGDDDNDDNLQDGTGFGEGKGKKNVSNEVEDEEQLLGLKKEDADDDEEEKEKKDKRDDSKEEEEDNDDPNKDDAVDMENDFEGDIHDEDKKENENNSDEDDDDGEDEEELDREMGDLGDDKEAVDERLWGNDSDDEEEEIDKENEKYEKDAPMKSNDEQEDEMRAKDDKEEEEGEGNNHDEDDGEESKQEQKNKQRDEEGQEDEENNNENDGDDGEKEDEKVNRDDLDNEIEKNQLPMPPEENEEEDGEEGTEREPDAPPEIGDDDLDLPSNPDEDENEEEENAENGMDIENEEHGDEQDSENHDSDAENDEDQEKDKNKVDEDNTSIGSTDNPDKEENPDNLSKNKENESNKELIPAPFSMDIDKPSNSIDTGATEEEKNEKKKNSSLQGKEESNADNDESNAKGSIGNQSSKEKNPADSIEEEEEDDDDSGDEFDMKQTEKPTKNERENEMSQMNQNRETKLSERNSDPNPWKNAGDAKKQWHRRLQMIQEHSAPESLEEKSLPKLEEKEDNEMDIDDANEQQFSSSDRQNNEPTTQTLGPANKDSDMIIPESLDDEEEDAEEPQVDSAMEEDMANKEEMSKEDITEADERQDMEEEEKPKEPLSDSRKKKKQKTKSNFEGNDNDDNANKMKSPLERLDSAESDPVIASNTDILASLSSSGMMLDEKKRELFMKKLINRGIKNNLTADDLEQGNELWSNAVSSTRESSQRLCEKLRLLLAPTLATKLQGDYRTGKRINMRKVIPFIASQFRKDAIWLRRTKPSKREYRVILALDNSKSMEVVGVLALQALALIAKSMTSLEVGKIGVYSFGDSIDNLHDLHSNTPLTDDIGGRIASHFQFKQDKTHIKESLITICRSFDENQVPSQLKNGSNFIETRQLVILISDGRFDSGGREDMKREIQLAFEKGQLVVLVIVEPPGVEGIENVVHVTYKKKVPVITKYLDNYPFPYYVIVKDAKELPETLADALRQWFELLSLTSG